MNGRKRNTRHWRGPGRIAAACALIFLGLWSSVFAAVTASLNTQGYLFMHPFFASRAWKSSLTRLDVVLPDDFLTKNRPQAFDVSLGGDNAVAVFSVNRTSLYCMPVLHESLVAPCLDNALTFSTPEQVTLGRFSAGTLRALYVVKDTLYSSDSLRVAAPSSVAPLKVYIARIGVGASAVTKLDSIMLTEETAGQRILAISGNPDPVSRQDRGIWVTGTRGLIRYIPYTKGQWGVAVLRDLVDTSAVLHTNGVYAGTKEGRLYKWNSAASVFNPETASAGGPVWRVYQQGAIGDNGLFKENSGGVWKNDTAFGASAYRIANFIRLPGGFGVELLDSTWKYSAYTYRDTFSIIESTVPAQLRDSVNRAAYNYQGPGKMNITVNVNDPDSNYSDYRLFLESTDLKNDGVHAIDYAAMPDTGTCRIGTLKMTSGSVRLVLALDSVKIMHDCALGTLHPTCNSCYWKPYPFARSIRWVRGNVVRLTTSTQTLRISNGSTMVTSIMRPDKNSAGSIFRARFAGSGIVFEFPLKTGVRATGLAIHDLKGRQLASLPVRDQRIVTLPAFHPIDGVVIATCFLSDGSSMSRKVPIMK